MAKNAKANIHVDEFGYRSVDRGGVKAGEAAARAAESAPITRAEVDKLIAQAFQQFKITGTGVSGRDKSWVINPPTNEQTVTIPTPPGEGEYVLVATNGELSWEEVGDCDEEEEEE